MKWRIPILAASCLALLAGCVTPIPPSPQEIEAKRFETVPGKAVIYLFRDAVNYQTVAAPVALDGVPVGSSYAGTFLRFVVEPGKRRLAGTYQDIGAIEMTVAANQIYFVQHTAIVTRNVDLMGTAFTPADPATGRSRVAQYQLTGNY
jgi:hypothetical protein